MTTPSAPLTAYTEVFDETSAPTQDEIVEYASRIGINPEKEGNLLSVAEQGLTQRLPSYWKPCFDEQRNSWYYFNTFTGKSQWEHPLDDVYREIVAKSKSESSSTLDSDMSLDGFSRHLDPLERPGKLEPLGLPRKSLLAPITKKKELKIGGAGASFLRSRASESSVDVQTDNSKDEKVSVVSSSLDRPPPKGILRDTKAKKKLWDVDPKDMTPEEKQLWRKQELEAEKKSIKFNLEVSQINFEVTDSEEWVSEEEEVKDLSSKIQDAASLSPAAGPYQGLPPLGGWQSSSKDNLVATHTASDLAESEKDEEDDFTEESEEVEVEITPAYNPEYLNNSGTAVTGIAQENTSSYLGLPTAVAYPSGPTTVAYPSEQTTVASTVAYPSEPTTVAYPSETVYPQQYFSSGVYTSAMNFVQPSIAPESGQQQNESGDTANDNMTSTSVYDHQQYISRQEELNTAIKLLETEKSSMQLNLQTAIKELDLETKSVEIRRQQKESELTALAKEFEILLTRKKDEFHQEMLNLELEAKATKEKLHEELSQIRDMNNDLIKSLSSERQRLQKEIAEMQEDHKQCITRLRASYDDEINNLAIQKKKELEEVLHEHEKNLAATKITMEKEVHDHGKSVVVQLSKQYLGDLSAEVESLAEELSSRKDSLKQDASIANKPKRTVAPKKKKKKPSVLLHRLPTVPRQYSSASKATLHSKRSNALQDLRKQLETLRQKQAWTEADDTKENDDYARILQNKDALREKLMKLKLSEQHTSDEDVLDISSESSGFSSCELPSGCLVTSSRIMGSLEQLSKQINDIHVALAPSRYGSYNEFHHPVSSVSRVRPPQLSPTGWVRPEGVPFLLKSSRLPPTAEMNTLTEKTRELRQWLQDAGFSK